MQLRSTEGMQRIQLTDMSGKVLLSQDGGLRLDATLDVHAIAHGIYLVQILHEDDQTVVRKLIKR